MWERQANWVVFLSLSDHSDRNFFLFGHFIRNVQPVTTWYSGQVWCSHACVLLLTARLQPPTTANNNNTNTHICSCSSLCSSLAGSARPQDSLASPTSSSRVEAERVSFLWRLCVSGQLVYSHHSVELCCMERGRPSSYPRGSSLADLHWQISVWRVTPKPASVWTQKHRGPVGLLLVFRGRLWCCFHPVKVVRGVWDIQPCFSSRSSSSTLPATMSTCHR